MGSDNMDMPMEAARIVAKNKTGEDIYMDNTELYYVDKINNIEVDSDCDDFCKWLVLNKPEVVLEFMRQKAIEFEEEDLKRVGKERDDAEAAMHEQTAAIIKQKQRITFIKNTMAKRAK